MSEQTGLKRNWKFWLNIITVGALLIFAILIRHQLAQTIENFSQVHAWALLLIIPIEYFNYHSQAKLYQSLFGILGNQLGFKGLFETSLELNFVNSVFPSGGVSGVSYFGVRMRSDHVTGGRAAVVQLMKLVMIFISFEILLCIGLLVLAISGRSSDITILIAGSLTTLVVGLTGLFMFIIGSEKRISSFLTFITKVVNQIVHMVRPSYPEAINVEKASRLFAELHHNYIEFRHKYKELRMPLVWAFFANLTEVLAVYVVYVAFGHWVNIGAVIIAYAVANFAGFISILPGGVGMYEAIMTAVMASAGVAASLSIPVVIMYRVVNTVLQLPPGYFFYRRTLLSNPEGVNSARS